MLSIWTGTARRSMSLRDFRQRALCGADRRWARLLNLCNTKITVDAVCFIAARTVTVSAATAGIAVSGVAVVIGVAVEGPAEGFSKIVVEFVSEVVNLVDQVQQMLRGEGIGVEHRGD